MQNLEIESKSTQIFQEAYLLLHQFFYLKEKRKFLIQHWDAQDSILQYNNNSLTCPIENDFPLWGCIINNIKIGNYSLNKEYILTVNTDLYYSTIPLELYRYLKETLFSIEFSSKCTKQLDKGHDEYINCKEDYIKTLNNNIEIIIGDKKFIFLLKNLFDCDDKKSCRSIFVYCSEHMGQFNIGNSVL